MTQPLRRVAHALRGKAGVALTTKLHMGLRHDTLLRIIRAPPRQRS